MRDCFDSIFEKILFDLDEYIYICDYETDAVLYMNKKVMDTLKIDKSSLGKPCYEVLRGSNERCSVCPKVKIAPADLDKKIKWESVNPLANITLENEGHLIKWQDDKIAYFQKSIDVTEHKVLEKKSSDRLVRQELMSQISQSFISSGDIDQNIDKTLINAADIMNYDAAMLLIYDAETTIITCSNLYYSDNLDHKISDLVPKYFRSGELIYDRFITNKEPYIILKNEECSYYEHNFRLGMRSTLVFPVWCESVFLGVIKFDRLDANYLWEDDDLHLAGMIAGAFSGVLNRDRIAKNLKLMNEVVEQSSQMLVHFEMGGKFRFFNNAVSKLTGYSYKELDEHGYNLLHDAPTIQRIENEIIPAVLNGERINTELTVICKDKSLKFMQYSFFPVHLGLGAVVIDITADKMLKNELNITKQQLNIAVESSGIGVWDINLKTQMISFDSNFSRIFRMPESMKPPISMSEWTDYLANIVDPIKYKDILEYHRNYNGSIPIDTQNITYQFAENDYLFIRNSRSNVFDEYGNLIKVFGITWDVTNDVLKTKKLKETQDRLDISIKISNAGVWELNLKDSTVTFDEGFTNLLRLPAINSLSINDFYKYISKIALDNDRYLEFFKSGYKTPYDMSDVVIKYTFGRDDIIYLSHSARVMFDIYGNPERLIGMSVDVTRFTQTEIALERRLKQQEMMADIAQRFVNYNCIDNAINESLQLVGEFANVSSVHIYQYDNINNIYNRKYSCDLKSYILKYDYISSDYINTNIILSENDITITPNLIIDANMLFNNVTGMLEYTSMAMPLIVNGSRWGFIGYALYESIHDWTESDKDMLRFLAGMIGTAIEGEIAESELSISESTLNAVIDNLPIAVYWKNTETKVFEGCNQEYLNILEKPADQVVGKRDCEIFSDRYMESYLKREKETFESKGTFVYVQDVINNSNKLRTIKLNRTILRNKDGVPFREISTVEDITESNLKELQIREMLERHNLVIKNYNGVIVNIGLDGSIKLFGGKSLFDMDDDIIIGKHYHDVCKNQPQMRSAVDKCFTDGTQSFIYHGENAVTKCQVTRVFDDDGNVASVLFVGQDITELYKVQNELENAIVIAKEASRAKSDFLARMSHEIRTPMNAIVGMSRIASETDDISRVRYCLEKIDTASANLLELINQILDMSKIEANKLELEMTQFNLKSIIDEIIMFMSMKIDEKKLNISVIYNNDFTNNYIGDKLRLSQVITNLLSNAVKFTETDGSITIKASAMDDGDEYSILTISVIDTGIGVKKEHQNSIFNSFEQADGSTSRKYGGTGLGLSICKNITKLMDGDIFVESEEGKGSAFTFYVRLRKMNGININQSSNTTVLDYKRKLGGKTILLAEDNEINREIVISILDDMGVKVHEAENGKVAVDLFIANPAVYDLILMDLQMPEMNGYDATRIIRSADNMYAENISILAMTANVFKDDVEKCLQTGMNDHIPKPIDVADLRSKIHKYIR